ncbi:MAG TPA: hypothetical protein VJG83_04440 [archaeon]|nr:hypothetical protein [archaeon]
MRKIFKKNSIGKIKKLKFPFPFHKKLPKPGKRLELDHMPTLARQLYKRLSELTGIPTKELMPWRGNMPPIYKGPEYKVNQHSIWVHSPISHFAHIFLGGYLAPFLLGGPKTSLLQHENIHGIINLMDRSIENIREEPYANIGALRVFGVGISGIKFQHKVNEFYRKYGTDGLLALFSSIKNIQNLHDLDKLEKMLVEEKILTSAGFSDKGIKWFKEKTPAVNIREKLRIIKEMRGKRGLSIE